MFFILGFSLSCLLPAADEAFYLGDTAEYDPAVPKPASVLGFSVGEWHVRHDQLVAYMETLAKASDRVAIETIGHTHELRRLVQLTISSPENLARLDEIKRRHRALSWDGDPNVAVEDSPVVVWLGYSIHGNESSGSNASMLVAYHLAAASGLDELLRHSVIILDPSLNPDGLSRFAQWANMHRGKNLNADENHREHDEGWPSGRTNHYWFDLNRDWLLLQHPESRARVRRFQEWRPTILTDFHEMGTGSTFFFQPGIPTRQNPLTPKENLDLTRLIAKHHAAAFNDQGKLYFSEQIFDDFYYGKGSTYPDVQGGIGILFEQASSRGHLQENSYGRLHFEDTIKNQVTTSFSTLRAGLEHRTELLTYQRDFFKKSLEAARSDTVKGYVFGSNADPARAYEMANVLLQHRIDLYRLAKPVTQDGVTLNRGFVVPLQQHQYRLVKSLFATMTEFEDETFYDISTWHFPAAYGLFSFGLTGKTLDGDLLGEKLESLEFPQETFSEAATPYAYLFEWNGYYAPRAAYRLLQNEVRLRFATKTFSMMTRSGEMSFGYGTIMIPLGAQKVSPERIASLLQEAAAKDGVRVYSVDTGLTGEGVDLGSPSFDELKKPKALLLVGDGVSTYEAGEVWHLLDQRFDIALTLGENGPRALSDLDRYTHLILVSGNYGDLNDSSVAGIKNWIREGGTLVALKRAARWAAQVELCGAFFKEDEEEEKKEEKEIPRLPYVDRSQIAALQGINGTIFLGTVDLTHPLGYGLESDRIALFRNSTLFMNNSNDPYSTVIRYLDKPLHSGYVSEKNIEKIKGSASLIAEGSGRGSVILMMDNPNFRGFWLGTNKLFLNALFFSSAIQDTRNIPY